MLHGKIYNPIQRVISQMRYGIIGAAVAAMTVSPAAADGPPFSLPIDCVVGETCWLVNMVDRDPGPGYADFRCGALSYDGHRGTDIAIANHRIMQRGVAVLAAADGVVLRLRDGVPPTTEADLRYRESLKGRECGNGIMIDHGGGWSTQYCHLKAGSIDVSPGTRVRRGDRIADVGLTGLTEFPHVHMTIRQDRTVIDPFTGESQAAACRREGEAETLWTDEVAAALAYPGPQPYHMGFAMENPDADKMRDGLYTMTSFPRNAPALVFWAEAFSLAEGDILTVRLSGPDGETIADNRIRIDRPQARRFAAIGRRMRGDGWAPGTYTGQIEIRRNGMTVSESATAAVE